MTSKQGELPVLGPPARRLRLLVPEQFVLDIVEERRGRERAHRRLSRVQKPQTG